MFKRFHDTEKWKLPWYRKLSTAEKCAWDYITSNCDNVGVWVPDFEMAEYCIGGAIDWENFAVKCNGNIAILNNGKWWLVDFCKFQYSELSEDSNSKPIISYVKLLKMHGLWTLYNENQRVSIGYTYGIHTVQDKDKDKDKDKEQEGVDKKSKYGPESNVTLTDSEYQKLREEYGKTRLDAMLSELSYYKLSSGKKYKSDYGAIRKWVADKVIKSTPKTTELQNVADMPGFADFEREHDRLCGITTEPEKTP
jgi:hypothetical protein